MTTDLENKVQKLMTIISQLSPESQKEAISIIEEIAKDSYEDGRKDGAYFGTPTINLYPERKD